MEPLSFALSNSLFIYEQQDIFNSTTWRSNLERDQKEKDA